MSGQMLVLFAKWTGHVLSAATVTAIPTTPLTADTLAGTALPLRKLPGSTVAVELSLAIPTEELDVKLVDICLQVLENPFLYEIGSDGHPMQLPVPLPEPKIAFVSGDPSKLTVTLPALPAATGLNVLVCENRLAPDAAEAQRTVTVDQSSIRTATVTTDVPGPRTVLALVAGYPLVVATV